MYTAYSACPSAAAPAAVPGSYRVLPPPPTAPVGRMAFRARLSTAPALARELRAQHPVPALAAAVDSSLVAQSIHS